MAMLPAIVAVAGMAMSAYQAHSNAKSQKKAYEYQAQVGRNNAKIAEWNAQDIARRGEDALVAQRLKASQVAGTQRAALAGRGIDLSEGSALNILTDTDYLSEQDSLTVQDNTNKNVWAARVQANNEAANAGLYEQKADNINPLLDGASSLLTNAPKVHSAWKQYSNG